jgi:hypothetical protein
VCRGAASILVPLTADFGDDADSGIGGGGGELNHSSESAMGWLAVLLIVLGVLAMLSGGGLVLGMRNRSYAAWREARGPEGSREEFEQENEALAGIGRVLIRIGVGLAIGGALLWFAR